MSGFENEKFDNIALQVVGKNKLYKEIEEITKTDQKELFSDALHRNEMTYEIEGQDHYLSQDEMHFSMSNTSVI